MTINEFLIKYDNKEQFTESELSLLFWGDFDDEDDSEVKLIDTYQGENRRWSYTCCHYYQIKDRYFVFEAEIGLTEYQDNFYNTQPQEMKLTIEKKVITVEEKHWEVVS